MDESSQSEGEDMLNNSFENDHKFDNDIESYSSNSNEEIDNLNVSRGKKLMRLLTDPEKLNKNYYVFLIDTHQCINVYYCSYYLYLIDN